MYIAFSIGLIIITIFLTFWSKLEKFRKKYTELYNFGLTLVATFIGVFLAIYLTNFSEEKKEKNNVIKLLDATVLDLNNNINKAKTTYAIAKFGADSVYSSRKHIENNPLQLPRLFQSIVNNEVVLRHLSKQGIQYYHMCADNIVSLQTSINEGKAIEDSILLSTVQVYVKQMEFAKKIIALEEGIMEGDISDKYIDEHYSQLTFDLIGIGPHDIETAIEEQKEREKK
jgi:hypothetical protein